MKNVSFETLKLKTYLDHLEAVPSIENAGNLLHALEAMKNENFQFIQDVFLSKLLLLMDSSDGLKKNEHKTILLKCMIIILEGSRILKDLPYKTIVFIVLKQIFDHKTNSYQKDLPEELKISIFNCLAAASSNLGFEAIEKFMVNENKILLGQCMFVCKEAIIKETYIKLRKSAIEALMCLSQCHDKFDHNDVVLKEQISKVIFIVLPQVATTLIKVCQEDTLRGPHVIQAALKCLGRFLSLILQDYEKNSHKSISNKEFMQLIEANTTRSSSEFPKITKLNAEKVEKSKEWMEMTTKNLSKIIVNLKCLRGSQHSKIRQEFAVLSYDLLSKCLPNCTLFSRFLLENLILFADDCDEKIESFSQKGLNELSAVLDNFDQEISELFSMHLTTMPRIIMTGLEAEQFAGMGLTNSYIKIVSNNPLLENQVIFEKFISVMLSCCEIDAPKELIFYETANSNSLNDEFYKLKVPWKSFKNLKNKAVVEKFTSICRNLESSRISTISINYIMDNINSIEYLVLLNTILSTSDSQLDADQLYSIMDEFLNDCYWSLPTKCTLKSQKSENVREEWFEESTPGLYESAVEVRLRDVKLDEVDENADIQTLKSIKYNILCTCTVLELVGNIAVKLQRKFQHFILRCLHLVLEKAGNSNFLIKSAGLYTLECISKAMGLSDVSQLIDINSDYLLFNVHKLLKHDHENEAVLDMMTVIFKYSTSSITSYVEDIVEMAANLITTKKASSYLKLFNLYVNSVKKWTNIQHENEAEIAVKTDWDEFHKQCLYELENINDEMNIDDESTAENVEEPTAKVSEEPLSEPDKQEYQLPQHIKLIIKILNTSLPYFASSNPADVILVHEIFLNGFPVLHVYETQLLPLVHLMWYPFTKQIQGKDFVVLQQSIRLLSTIGKLAKDFVYKKSMDNVVPIVNRFLKSSHSHTSKLENLSYTQEFKLQKELLNDYGQLVIDLGIDDKHLDEIIDILILYNKNHLNSQLQNAAKQSLDVIASKDPLLIKYKMNF